MFQKNYRTTLGHTGFYWFPIQIKALHNSCANNQWKKWVCLHLVLSQTPHLLLHIAHQRKRCYHRFLCHNVQQWLRLVHKLDGATKIDLPATLKAARRLQTMSTFIYVEIIKTHTNKHLHQTSTQSFSKHNSLDRGKETLIKLNENIRKTQSFTNNKIK